MTLSHWRVFNGYARSRKSQAERNRQIDRAINQLLVHAIVLAALYFIVRWATQ